MGSSLETVWSGYGHHDSSPYKLCTPSDLSSKYSTVSWVVEVVKDLRTTRCTTVYFLQGESLDFKASPKHAENLRTQAFFADQTRLLFVYRREYCTRFQLVTNLSLDWLHVVNIGGDPRKGDCYANSKDRSWCCLEVVWLGDDRIAAPLPTTS